jgi:hypothetical protein
MSPSHPLLSWIRTKLQDLFFPLRMHLGRKIMYDCQRQIVQISCHTLVKGPCSEQELEAMRYVAAHTKVLLPWIHRIYRRREGLYIAMDFVRGEGLDKLWPNLNYEESRRAVEVVCKQITALHAITVPPQLGLSVASCEGGAVRDGILSLSPLGPFPTVTDFYKCLEQNPNLDAYRQIWDSAGAAKARCVLSHADIAPRNIIRRTVDGELVLIDWEFAGWWPKYWDRVKWHSSDFPEVEGWVGMMHEAMSMEW